MGSRNWKRGLFVATAIVVVLQSISFGLLTLQQDFTPMTFAHQLSWRLGICVPLFLLCFLAFGYTKPAASANAGMRSTGREPTKLLGWKRGLLMGFFVVAFCQLTSAGMLLARHQFTAKVFAGQLWWRVGICVPLFLLCLLVFGHSKEPTALGDDDAGSGPSQK